MLLEAFIISGIIIAIILRRKKENNFFLRVEFVAEKYRIPFCIKSYRNWEEFEFIQDQLSLIALDYKKNSFFRDVNIIGISIIDVLSSKEFFYISLEKDT